MAGPSLRFSLRTLLLLVLLIGSVATVWWGRQAWVCEAVLEIDKTGGAVFPIFSEDGKSLFIWCPSAAYQYDPISLEQRRSYPNLIFAGYSSSFHRIVLRDYDLHVFDSNTSGPAMLLKTNMELPYRVQFSPTELKLVASGVGAPNLWDVQTGQRLHEFRTRARDEKSDAIFLPDGRRVVAVEGDELAHVWDVHSGSEILTLKGHTGFIRSVSCSPNGAHIVTASMDHTARVWDSSTGKCIAELGHSLEVFRAQYSADGTRLVTLTDSTASIWDAEKNYELVHTVDVGKSSHILAISFEARRLLSESATPGDNDLGVWDLDTCRRVDSLAGHFKGILAAGFDPTDPNRVISGATDGTARIWRRRRPESPFGIVVLPATWLALIFFIGIVWSVKQEVSRRR